MIRWRELFARPRLTVVIPLHRAEPWIDVISENISLIPVRTRILLSDVTCHDGALDILATRHSADRRLRLRRGTGSHGWREHTNLLLQSVRTEFLAILPQDDSITPLYFEKLVAALDRNPSAGISFGSLDAIYQDGTRVVHPPPPFPLGQRPPWVEALELDQRWNLGVPYRGVVRRRLARPIPATAEDRYADLVWVFSMALVAHLVEVPDALYVKRYHHKNTHTDWSPLSSAERLAAFRPEIEARLRGTPEDRDAALAALEHQLLG